MSSDWIRRIFRRPLKNAPQAIATLEEKSLEEQNSIAQPSTPIESKETTEDQKIAYAEQLESAFFSWLLNCPDSPNTGAQLEQSQAQQTLLKLIDHDLQNTILIPRRPASLPMLIRLLNDENSSHTQMSKILLSDPALTSEILKMANSPFYRSSSEDVESIEQAVLILGRQGIRNIISTTIMMPMLKGEGAKEGPFSQRAWQWAQLSATASNLYAQVKDRDPGPLYLLGLLPSLAYLVIYRALLAYEKQHPELGPIEPSLIRHIIEVRSWDFCHKIYAEWGLPPVCESYLSEAEKRSTNVVYSPLRDGITLSRYKLLCDLNISPLNDTQLFNITSASMTTNNTVTELINNQTS